MSTAVESVGPKVEATSKKAQQISPPPISVCEEDSKNEVECKLFCHEHTTKELDIFCKKCNESICSFCLMFGKHKGHNCLPMESYITECKQKIIQHAIHLKGEVAVMKSSIGSLDQMISRVNHVHENYVTQITQSFEKAHEYIEKRKDELIEASASIKQHKIDRLRKQQKVIKSYAQQLKKTSNAFEVKANSLKQTDSVESLGTFEYVASEMISKVPTLTPCVNDAIESDANANDLISMIKKTGKIEDVSTSIPVATIWVTVGYLLASVFVVVFAIMISTSTHGVKILPTSCSTDAPGIIEWIGTNQTTNVYQNPIKTRKVQLRFSSMLRGDPSNDYTVIGSKGREGYFLTSNIPGSWISFDFGKYRVRPLRYAMKHGGKNNIMRHWELQGSNDHISWITLKKHSNDTTIPRGNACSVGVWDIRDPHQDFRYLRIIQTGQTSDETHYLTMGGFEVYGYVNSVDL